LDAFAINKKALMLKMAKSESIKAFERDFLLICLAIFNIKIYNSSLLKSSGFYIRLVHCAAGSRRTDEKYRLLFKK